MWIGDETLVDGGKMRAYPLFTYDTAGRSVEIFCIECLTQAAATLPISTPTAWRSTFLFCAARFGLPWVIKQLMFVGKKPYVFGLICLTAIRTCPGAGARSIIPYFIEIGGRAIWKTTN